MLHFKEHMTERVPSSYVNVHIIIHVHFHVAVLRVHQLMSCSVLLPVCRSGRMTEARQSTHARIHRQFVVCLRRFVSVYTSSCKCIVCSTVCP